MTESEERVVQKTPLLNYVKKIERKNKSINRRTPILRMVLEIPLKDIVTQECIGIPTLKEDFKLYPVIHWTEINGN